MPKKTEIDKTITEKYDKIRVSNQSKLNFI